MDNQSKIIEIAKIEMNSYETGNQYKITGTDGMKFKFYDTKKDGNPTVAFKQFQQMGLKIGSIVDVWFKEMQKEYEGKPYTDRLIASFREAQGKPATPTPKASPALNSYATEPKGEEFWDKKAYKQCLWGHWLEKDGEMVMEQEDMDLVWNVFNQIEQDANKRFAKGWAKAEAIFGEESPPFED